MRWERVHVNARARETPEGKRSAGRKGGIWGPGNRWGHTLNSVRGGRYLYVFGGYGKDNSQTNDVHVFDTIKQTWSKPMVKGVLPSPRDSHSCTTVGNYLFVFGGTDGKKPLKDLHILDTSSNTWILPTLRGKGPDAREGHSAALVDKRLFIFGGCGKSGDDRNELYYNDLYILDTENLIWERAMTSGTPPSARDSHTCSSWKNKIVVLGGEDASDYYLSDVHILDADTLMWKELNTSGQMLAPRAGHSTVALGRNLFVFGGFTDDRNLYDDLHILNVDTGIWSRVTNINQGPSARFSVAGDCLDEQKGILVFIGGCNATLEALDDMYYLHTDMPVQNGLFEQRQEKLSLRKELKRKCQEKYIPTKGLEKNNDVPKLSYQPLYLQGCSQAGYLQGFIQKGAQIPDSKPAVEKIFEARVTDASHYGYTIETTIDGKLLRGILFSWKSSSGQDNHAYLKKKRMETDEGSIKLNNSYQSVLKTAEVIHQEKNSSGQGKIDVTHGKEPTLKESPTKSLASDSTNSAPLADVYQPKVERGNLVSSTPHGGMKNNIAPDGPYKPNAGNPCGIPSPTPPSSSSQVRDAVEHHHSSSKCPQDSK